MSIPKFGNILEGIKIMDKILFSNTPLDGEKPAVNVRRLNFFAGLVLSSCLVATGSSLAQGVELKESAIQQIKAMQQEKAARTPAQKKLSSKLVYALKTKRGDPRMAQLPSLRSQVREVDGQVKVDIRANVDDALLARIESLGGKVINSHPRFNSIRATLPLESLEILAASDKVRNIRQADRMYLNKINTSEGDVAHKADLARSGFTVDGSGQKVCVLSDSVDSLKDLQNSGDLPAQVGILQDENGFPLDGIPGSSEGTAMLEIVYDLAPGANLYFATAMGGQAEFAQNIIDLHTKFGCTVMVDDVGYYAEAVFQDGTVAAAVNQVTAAGVLYFSAAGNSGNKNDGTSGVWQGNFVGTAGPPAVEDLDVQNFGGGVNANTITLDSPSLFTLQWSDPQGASNNDYDLLLMDPGLTTILDAGEDFQDGTQDPYEWIDSEGWDDLGNVLLIVKYEEPGLVTEDRFMHLNTHRGRLAISTDGQTSGHSAATDAFSVAAVDWFKGSLTPAPFDGTESVETFSSDGPRQMFFNEDGSAITPGNFLAGGGTVRQKPDITAANQVSTATPGFDPFAGTSAAAPHAAAIAALMLEFDTSADVDLARTIFDYSSLDIEASGIDRDSGFGIVMADGALDALNKMDEDTTCDSIQGTINDLYLCSNNGPIAVGPGLVVQQSDGYLQLSGTEISFTGEVAVRLGGRLVVVDP